MDQIANEEGMRRQVLGWRGQDGCGPPLAFWLAAAAASLAVALLFAPAEPALVLIPPVLALAVLMPPVQALWKSEALSKVRSLVARLEMPLVMLAFATVAQNVFGRMLRNGMLIDSGDHQYMMGRAELFYEGLRQGHWVHWTHLWQGGDTITDLYPVEVNLLTAAVHFLSPRGTPFVASYTTFVLLAWWLRAIGAYYLARRFTTPAISFVLAYASLFDVGADVNGGVWFAAFFFGMIHNTLALTFGLFATALQVDLVRKVTAKRFVACVLLVALTACGHALGMMAIVVTTFALGLTVLLGSGPKREATWALAASGLGLALSAVWILPFSYGLKTLGYRVATGGAHYTELGKGMTEGSLPTSSFAAFLGLAVLAALLAALSEDIAVAFSGIASLILVLLVLTPLLVSSRVLDYFSAFLDAQPYRMLTAFKTTVLPCLAWVLEGMFVRVRARSGSLRVRAVARRALLIGILLYGPGRAVLGEIDQLAVNLRAQIPHKDESMERSHTGADYRKIFAWIKQRRAEDPDPVPWRTAILWRNVWRHATWTEGMNTGSPIVDPNQVPSNFLTIRPREISARAFNDWNVKYAITDYSGAPFPGATERFSAGKFHIWEVDDFDDRYVVAPPGVHVSNVALDGDLIRFTVSGAPPEGVELKLRTAAYPRWRARQNGQPLPVRSELPRPDAKPKQEQIVLRAGNGEVRVTCDGPLPMFWLGLLITVLSAVALPLVAPAARRERIEGLVERGRGRLLRFGEAVGGLPPRRLIAIGGAVAAALLVAGVFVRARGAKRLFPATLEGLSALTVSFRPDGGVSERCAPMPWAGRFVCGTQDTVVDSWLGTKGPGDDSGEFAALWPGIRVAIREKGTITLGFGRVHLDAPQGLWIETSGGTHHAKILWGDEVLGDSDLGGEKVHHIELPSGEGGTRPLRLELTCDRTDSYIVLRGGAGSGPPKT